MRQKTNTRLQKKYNRLFKKLQQALRSGQFLTYSATKKNALLNRLQGYENRLLRRGMAVLGTAALLMSGGEVLAQQPVRVGEEFRVNSFTTANQGSSNIGIDSDGDFTITWGSLGQDGDGFGIYAQRYASSGSALGSEFQVNTYVTNNQRNSEIIVDSDGGFIITWESFGQDGSSEGIYARRYASDGSALGSEFQVNTFTNSIQTNPSIAIDNNGNFIITWASNNQDGDGFGIYAQRYASNGNALGSEFQINTFTTKNQMNPSVAVDGEGNFIVTWTSNGQDGSSDGIYARRYASDGNPLGGEFQVNTFTTNSQFSSSIGINSDGTFVITWQSRDQDESDSGIYAQRYASDGSVLGSEFQVNTFTNSVQSNPSIAVDIDGDFVITWQSRNQDGSYNGIYAQYYNSDGSKISTEFQVNTYTTNSQSSSDIEIDNDGDFIITWSSNEQDGSSYGVYAQRYKIPTPTIPNINTLVLNTCTRPYSASFDAVTDAIGYQVQITVLDENGETITRRIRDNNINGNFYIPRRLFGVDVEAQIAAIFLDEETGEEVIGEFSEKGTFTLGCDEAGNLILGSKRTSPKSIQLSPNPVQNQLQVQLQSAIASAAELKILSLDGKILLEQQQLLFEGQNDLNINVAQLASGTYFLQIRTEIGVEQVKFVKL